MIDQDTRKEWVLVPKRPTPEMSRAVLEETRFCNPAGIYQKMLAAAPPIKTHPAITHCDNCGCDWLDSGLNPIGCPYCKQVALQEDVSEWKRVAAAQAELHGEAEDHANKLKEALKELITWFPSAGTYQRLGFDSVAPMKAYEKAHAALKQEMGGSDAISVVGMPEFDALIDHIYEYGTVSEGVIPLANAFAKAVLARHIEEKEKR